MISEVKGNKNKRGMNPSQRCSLSCTFNPQVIESQLSLRLQNSEGGR